MMDQIRQVETILYVKDQEKSTTFYQNLFRTKPVLHVPGMTEFVFSNYSKLGLMPNKGIAKIISEKVPHPDLGTGIPRCELYLVVDDVKTEYENALNCGAMLVNDLADRDWGDKVCYFSDPDGHILAFAEHIRK